MAFFKFFHLHFSTQILKTLFPKCIWNLNTTHKVVYLTFDDGPTPEVTLWVLNELKKYDLRATFFCIGKNIEAHPDIFKQIIMEGHQVANHTLCHEKGWKTSTKNYLKSVEECQRMIEKFKGASNNLLFRPPYGKMTSKQTVALRKGGYQLIMWSNISKDYQHNISSEKCFKNSIYSLQKGDIIVFHDSFKAFQNLKKVLPKTLEYLKREGFRSESIS